MIDATHITSCPTEMIIVEGKNKGGKKVEIYIDEETAKRILTEVAAEYARTGHVGSAFYYVNERKPLGFRGPQRVV